MIRANLRFFQSNLVPASLIGGTLGWVVKPAPKVKPVVVAAAPMGANKGVVRPGGLTASGYVVARTRATSSRGENGLAT